jgi:hypothetical protein
MEINLEFKTIDNNILWKYCRLSEQFQEDTQVIIRSRNVKKNTQYYGQMKTDKHYTEKQKIDQHEPNKAGWIHVLHKGKQFLHHSSIFCYYYYTTIV